jgi:hypothetical protein
MADDRENLICGGDSVAGFEEWTELEERIIRLRVWGL